MAGIFQTNDVFSNPLGKRLHWSGLFCRLEPRSPLSSHPAMIPHYNDGVVPHYTDGVVGAQGRGLGGGKMPDAGSGLRATARLPCPATSWRQSSKDAVTRRV